METVKVTNSRASIIWLPAPKDGKGARGMHKLMPGPNDVPSAIMDGLRTHSGVKHLIDHGILTLGGKAKPLIPPDAAATLKGADQADAIALVRSAETEEQLEKWAATEKRGPVLKAIEARIADLANPKAKQ